jgi:two-component system CheB/CheR fusion protein
MAELLDTTIDSLLAFVKDVRGFDFTGYKRSTIERRVARRMSEVGVERYGDYADYLELNPQEFASLFNTILINVTGFFRDPQTWEYMATEIVPAVIAARGPDASLRVWSAGCASGEEAYTIAMVLARVLGDEALRDRVKIYATDVDEDALDQARHGAYLPNQLEDVPRDALERFFERTEQRYVFRNDLRRSVIFGRNDLVQDAPISRIDLLVCRNTLMYFTAETQTQVLRRFHFALNDDGALLLGRSEMLVSHSDLFTPVDLKRRLFRKVVRPGARHRERVVAPDPAEAAFDAGDSAQVVLDSAGALVMSNDSARRMFGLGVSDFGRPIQDLELSYRPLELRSHLEVVSAEGRSVDAQAVRWSRDGRDRLLDVRLRPLSNDGLLMGTLITYAEVTDVHALREKLAAAKRDLEDASEELQSTVEELETTNEELQSTNEELETTNEELHSSNEELETMNEELRHRTLELHDVNSFLETILTTIGVAIAVLDQDQQVRLWNGHAYELWGLTADDAQNRHLLALDFGLPVEKLKPQLHACLSGASEKGELIVEATNRRGRTFRCRVTCLPLGSDGDGRPSGAIMMMAAVDD